MLRHMVKAVEANIDRTPLCPGCGKRMRLVQFSPKDDGELVLLSFGCRACGVSVTEEASRCTLPQPALGAHNFRLVSASESKADICRRPAHAPDL
jgi:hypothetical protein